MVLQERYNGVENSSKKFIRSNNVNPNMNKNFSHDVQC